MNTALTKARYKALKKMTRLTKVLKWEAVKERGIDILLLHNWRQHRGLILLLIVLTMVLTTASILAKAKDNQEKTIKAQETQKVEQIQKDKQNLQNQIEETQKELEKQKQDYESLKQAKANQKILIASSTTQVQGTSRSNNEACIAAAKQVFPSDKVPMAIAIMSAEGGRPDMIPSPTGDYGCWQINKASHYNQTTGLWQGTFTFEQVADPTVNAKLAYMISDGGNYWGAWTTYKSGAYLKYLQS